MDVTSIPETVTINIPIMMQSDNFSLILTLELFEKGEYDVN